MADHIGDRNLVSITFEEKNGLEKKLGVNDEESFFINSSISYIFN